MKLISRLRFAVYVALSNAFVILIFLVEQAQLDDVAKVYWFQLSIVFVITIVRILSAKYIRRPRAGSPVQHILKDKLITLGMFALFNGVFLAGHFFILFLAFETEEPSAETAIFIAKCSILFLIMQFLTFKRERSAGFHRKLIEEWEVSVFWIRMQLVLVPCLALISVKREAGIDYPMEQIVMIAALISVVESIAQIAQAEDYRRR